MEALWFGSAEDGWFDFNTISRNCKIKYPMLPAKISSKLNHNSELRVKDKRPDEIRILSADIALMSSKKHKNDATSIFINQMLPTKAGRYTSNIVYGDTIEGMHTEDQARTIRMLFDEYQCDYLVIDANGVGSGIVDILMRDINDPETGELYPALSCYNDPEMALRCTSPNAPKVIWSVKASAQFNSDCAYRLREGFSSGRVRLLLTEYDGEAAMKELKGFDSLSPELKEKFKYPYYNTSLLINELVKLQYEENNGKVKLYERSNMRKDRYSSLAYNYYVAKEIENKLNKKNSISSGYNDFVIKPPSYAGRTVSKKYGRWY